MTITEEDQDPPGVGGPDPHGGREREYTMQHGEKGRDH